MKIMLKLASLLRARVEEALVLMLRQWLPRLPSLLRAWVRLALNVPQTSHNPPLYFFFKLL
jgi:hypothetical protein